MSHLVKVKVQIKDLRALKEACDKLGLEFKENKKTFKWYSGNGRCSHAIGVRGAGSDTYEIGLTDNGDGTYGFQWDSYDRRLAKIAGEDCENIKREYSTGVARGEAQSIAKKYGFSVEESYDSIKKETTFKLKRYE